MARIDSPFIIGYYVVKWGELDYTICSYDGVPGHLAVMGDITPHGGLHFPYGIPVFPD